ncbi:T9SS type A sorting domain-containing protein [Chitinophaga horti]|uniref:T9SS type A sorting domain-containing protein n=1 Tax=Chitinophaga horti TaxID=2920382 RepID=A0ABY6IW78_9BACT|nr:T9SS type A sorting domain-containing protein [Chitinophaga horti]UYQ91456.1 T9SS type A sorting domain-containing protein [Chitinophaga horti]
MKQFYVCLLLILGMHTAMAQVRISMLVPKSNQVLGNKVFVEGYAASSAGPITSVRAQINTQEVTMNIANIPYFFGNFNLSTLPSGPLQLHIIATDALNNQLDTVINVLRNNPPTVVLESPVSEAVARPLLRVKAHAVDDGPVSRMEVRFATRTYVFNGSSVDTIFDASAEVSPLSVYAIDASDAEAFATSYFTVDITPGLKQTFSLPSDHNIMEFNYGQVISMTDMLNAQYQPRLHLTNYPGGVTKTIPGVYRFDVSTTQLKNIFATPRGVVWTGNRRDIDPAPSGTLLYQFLDSGVTVLQAGIKAVRVAGKYIAWTSQAGDSLFLRDQLTQTNTYITRGVGYIDVDSIGRVHYTLSKGVYLYNQGVTSLVMARDASTPLHYIDTDGDYLSFYVTEGNINDVGLSLYKDGVRTSFGELRNGILNIPLYYRLTNGHLAFMKHVSDRTSVTSFYIKSPGDSLKLLKQLTRENRFGSEELGEIRGLNANGDLMIWENIPNSGTQQISYHPKNGSSKSISSLPLTIYDINGKWYGSYLNTLYEIQIDADYSADATPFTKPLLINQSGRFGVKDFTSHFSGPEYGPGQLTEVKLIRLPTWGNLVHPNGTLLKTTGQVLKRSELEGLRYVPFQNVIGADTVRWEGKNGTVFGNQAAITLMTHPNLTAAPKLSGLDSTYCSTVTADVIKITNYPPVKWRTSVTVLLDDTTILPVGQDSSFTITPTAGSHTLTVKFRHPLDSISTTARFTTVDCNTTNARIGKIDDVEIVSAYPNPFNSQFTVTGLNASNRYTLSLHDVQGSVVYTGLANNQQSVVIIPNVTLQKGIYYLKVYDVALRKVIAVTAVVKM